MLFSAVFLGSDAVGSLLKPDEHLRAANRRCQRGSPDRRDASRQARHGRSRAGEFPGTAHDREQGAGSVMQRVPRSRRALLVGMMNARSSYWVPVAAAITETRDALRSPASATRLWRPEQDVRKRR
jgi:hypothetical protein